MTPLATTEEEMRRRKYGRLSVLGPAKRIGKHIAWKCVCDCGRERVVRGDSLRSGNTTSCNNITCRPGNGPTALAKNKTIGYLKSRMTDIWRRSKKRDLFCEIDLEHLYQLWVNQEGKCAITGLSMTTMQGHGMVSTNLSVDRINNAKGYEIGNVQLVCHRVNGMKSAMETEKFIEFCRRVTYYNSGGK